MADGLRSAFSRPVLAGPDAVWELARAKGGYVWRDPARLPATRIAELAAHDDYIASLHEEPDETRSEVWQAAHPTARQLTWNRHRARGLTVAQAALRMALGKGTARRYERIRNRIEQQEEAAAQ